MSTRCQVQVTDSDGSKITLYHHTDGYCEYMIPLLDKAFKFAHETKKGMSGFKFKDEWKADRAGHVASFLCHVDPTVFEPETGHKLHADIEFYYRIYTMLDCTWEVEILTPRKSFWTKKACVSNMSILYKRQPLAELRKIFNKVI